MRGFFSLVLLFFLVLQSRSQQLPGQLDELKLLKPNNSLPADLLSSRTAVYIQVPDKKGKNRTRGDWKGFAFEAHNGFKRMGIDAVAYYYYADVKSGLDAHAGFISPLENRNINNIIFLVKHETILGTEVEIIVTKRAKSGLTQINQPAYVMKRNALREILVQLGRDIYAQKLVNTNFMIPDSPEFFTDTNVVRGRRYESFNSDLRIGKLAVPLMAKYRLPVSVDSIDVPQDKWTTIGRYNEAAEQANKRLEEIMTMYPYKYELVDYAVGEDHLYRREFSYVLMFIHSTGRTIREFLNYDVDLNETDYITLKTEQDSVTTLKQFPATTPVFKFYMKQLVNKEVYLGDQWDADDTWEGALINHLNNFSEVVDKKNN